MSNVLVGSAYGVLELRSQQFDQGVDASLAKLAQLRQAFSQGIPPLTLPPVGGNLPGPNSPRQLPGGQAADIQKDEQAMLRYAQSLATAQKAQGDLSGAASTYRSVLSQLTPNTIEANRATAQLAATEAQLAKETALASQAASVAGEQGSGLASVFGAVASAAAVAVPALAAFKAAADLAQVGAQAEVVGKRFDSLSVAAGTTGDALLGALRKASGGQISDLSLELSANKAQFLDVAHSAQEFSSLMAIARDRAQAMGLTTAEAFEKISVGVGRASPRILDDLGLVINEAKAYSTFAASLHKASDELTDHEKKQAILKAVLDQGNASIAATGGAIEGNAAAFSRGGAALENTKNALGAFLAGGIAPIADRFATTVEATQRLSHWFSTLGTTVPGADAALAAFDAEMARSGDTTRAEIAYQKALADARAQATDGTQQATAAVIEGGGAYGAYAAAARDAAAGQHTVTGATFDYIASLQASAAASIEDTSKKELQQAATALLAEKSRLAVDQFLALNPTISDSAAVSQAAAQGYNAQIQKLILLGVEARNAQRDLAALNGGASEGRSERDRPGDLAASAAAGAAGVRERADAAAQARVNQILQTGTATQKVAERQKEYNDALRQFGANSKQAIDAQTQLIQAQQAAEKAGGRRRVDAAASTALQLQNVEENSQAQLLKAQREGLERLRDQAEDFDVHRARAQEDNAEKRRSLLAHGQRAQAAELQRDFEKEQKRNQEDFDRQRRRTVRNNQEASGDITGGLERRQGQISERAALRGSRTGAAVDLGANATPSAKSGGASAAGGARVIQVVITGRVDMDGREVGTLIYNAGLREQIDTDLALTIAATSAPGSGQSAVGGNG